MMSMTPAAGPAVEKEIALDVARKALLVSPVFLVAAFVGWGADGALSSGYALGIVLGNFLLSAVLLGWAAGVSLTLVVLVAMFGYIIRLGTVVAAVLLVKDLAWVEMVPLGLTLVVAHVGLLFWETRNVSASLAFPGLKPRKD